MDNARRQTLRLLGAGAALASLSSFGVHAAMSDKPVFAYVGCRTTKARNARGKGISVYRVRSAGRPWELVQVVEGLDNPSFLTLDRAQSHLYAVHGDLSDISAFAIDPLTGQLQPINRQSTQGLNPVHLAIDPTGQFVVVANYASGSVVTLPILPNGGIGDVADLFQLFGQPGPHREQHDGPHPHEVPFDPTGQYIFVPDKGVDRIFALRMDGRSGKLQPAPKPYVASTPGAGPRHIAFNPTGRLAYVVNELDSTITTYQYDASTAELIPLQTLSTLPSGFAGESTGAEIQIDKRGRFVFASNRGHDSVVTMAVDAKSGLLSLGSWTPTGGKAPRFFTVPSSGQGIYVANESSDSIVEFNIDADTGQLTPNGNVVPTGSPVCIIFKG
uniref:lactonase family protein n=1 Tax=Cupriavidus yeoncheonensis TaxID=1462994 RepID=UPI003F4979F5